MAEQANYQGEHVGLRLNIDAVGALEEALQGLRFSSGFSSSSREVPLRLPDGRTLQLRLSLTDAGSRFDEHGEYVDDDGLAHGDVTGDLEAHAEARAVLNAAARSYLLFETSDVQLAGDEPVDLEEIARRRVDVALADLPSRRGRTDAWQQQLRERALEVARAELPGVLEYERDRHRQRQADREELSAASGTWTYRGSTVADGELVERLIADGLASPAARDDSVEEVVRQVVEANAVDWGDPADAHDFPRRANPSTAHRDDEQDDRLEVRPPVRLRNQHDNERRLTSESARLRARWAAEDAEAGQVEAAADWSRSAGYWADRAQRSREQAIDADQADRARDPHDYSRRLAEAHGCGGDRWASAAAVESAGRETGGGLSM